MTARASKFISLVAGRGSKMRLASVGLRRGLAYAKRWPSYGYQQTYSQRYPVADEPGSLVLLVQVSQLSRLPMNVDECLEGKQGTTNLLTIVNPRNR
jgi:hypothetical protein